MSFGFSRRILFSILFISLAAIIPMSCTLNPLSGMLTNLSVKIISPETGLNSSVKINSDQVHLFSTAPGTKASVVTDFDCVAFNSTGYGIDIKETPDGEFPLTNLQFGAETPMQDPNSVTDLTFQVQFPTLIGFDPEIQKRLIQVYGVFTSNTDKTTCQGKNLSDFILNEDPYATVYLIGTGLYPSSEGACSETDLCILSTKQGAFFDTELVNSQSARKTAAHVKRWKDGMSKGAALFEDDDLTSNGGSDFYSNDIISIPASTNTVARVDLYFELSNLYVARLANFKTDLELKLKAQLYQNSGSDCNDTPLAPTTYSQVSVKYWNGTDLRWDPIPRKLGAGNSDVLPGQDYSSFNYTLDDIDLSQIQRTSVDGKRYFIVSIRANNTNCSQLSINRLYSIIQFN